MKQVSNKRRRLNASVEDDRQALRVRVGRCEVCLKPAAPEWLDIHELTPGYCRSLALDKDYARMCATRQCHAFLETLTIPNQLAYLYVARPSDFDLPAYHKLIDRVWPDWDEVSAFVDKILSIQNLSVREGVKHG